MVQNDIVAAYRVVATFSVFPGNIISHAPSVETLWQRGEWVPSAGLMLEPHPSDQNVAQDGHMIQARASRVIPGILSIEVVGSEGWKDVNHE